ncbi:ABC transporter permease [Tepidibacter formicigenes]|jgi:ABC-type transport system involved in multi-copper enzyme maturation permease subunit|uniref:ABC-2 family transporter protein n=1 Tax=Tepidibacter formicigenes DSM 15518 TaxID=1123349 RepID=A0A1M6J7E2_9FIRM|nr:ABC transporter permease [Tepidibacter formicigenes]SHJ42602.1 ABC-2 family transporter protein [Tepidibacter formicigenes DSM 15518]
MLFNLYKKEVNKLKKETIIFLGLALIINIFFLYKTYNGWNLEAGFFINMFLLPAAFLIPLILSESKLINQEFKNNTIYLLMSLPVSSQKIFLSKFLAVITQYIVSSLSIIIFTGIQFIIFLNRTSYIQEIKTLLDIRIFSAAICFYIFSIVGLIYIVSTVFLSSIIGKTFKKYSKLISFGSFFLVLYIGGKIIGFMMNMLEKVHISLPNNIETQIQILHKLGYEMLLISLIILFVTSAIYFIICRIYDKKIEI